MPIQAPGAASGRAGILGVPVVTVFFTALGAAALVVILLYNTLVGRRNQVDNSYSSIDVMLKKRWDLIPNLVETVQRYMEHESGVLEEVARLRSRTADPLSPDEAVELDNQIGRALSQIIATAESYPELKANEGFQQLQRALNEVEEQISASRRTYNAAVKVYNDTVQMFPTNVVAGIFGFMARPFFTTAGHERERPDVGALFGNEPA